MGKQIFPKIIDNCKKMEIPKNNDGVKKVQSNYSKHKSERLVDIIFKNQFDINKISKGSITRVWDHKTNDVKSITAGIKGLHIYVIPKTLEIMGLVLRT